MAFSVSGGGGAECPKCRRTMRRLADEAGPRNEGVIASNDEPSGLIGIVFGRVWALVLHHVVVPLGSLLFGNLKTARRQKTLQEYPRSLICLHCGHILRRK